MREIFIKSTLDGSLEPSLYYSSDSEEKRPLLVGLHTWSHGRNNQIGNMLPYAEKYNFNLLLPEFRGPNLISNPRCREACGSPLAKQDILDSILYVAENENVDRDNIFLLGLSGGGQMATLMAGFCPEIFRAVGAFVPIMDLSRWVEENAGYAPHVLACAVNGEELALRSPINYIDEISKANIKIFHGKWDKVVPVTQSISFYNKMMERHPDAKCYLDIFDGGHEIDMDAAFYWFLSESGAKNLKPVTG